VRGLTVTSTRTELEGCRVASGARQDAVGDGVGSGAAGDGENIHVGQRESIERRIAILPDHNVAWRGSSGSEGIRERYLIDYGRGGVGQSNGEGDGIAPQHRIDGGLVCQSEISAVEGGEGLVGRPPMTVKTLDETAVPPGVTTVIGPLAANGTLAFIPPAVVENEGLSTPLNATDWTFKKLVPITLIHDPGAALSGTNPVMTGLGNGTTIKVSVVV
jgi:hypothetical protein